MRTSELSPLQQIERRVQHRAKEISLDMATGDGGAKLRALIDDEVQAWSADYKRGLRDFDLAEPERAWRNLAGYGPLESLLADDDVWDIMVDGPDAIFVKRHRGPSSYHDEVFTGPYRRLHLHPATRQGVGLEGPVGLLTLWLGVGGQPPRCKGVSAGVVVQMVRDRLGRRRQRRACWGGTPVTGRGRDARGAGGARRGGG